MNLVGKDTTDEAANEVVSRDDNNNSSFLLPPESTLAFLESLTMPLVSTPQKKNHLCKYNSLELVN